MDEEKKDQLEEKEPAKEAKDEAPQSIVVAQFIGPGQSGFMLSIKNVDPWQLAGLAAELTDRAEEGRKMHRRQQLQEVANRNLEMLGQQRPSKKAKKPTP